MSIVGQETCVQQPDEGVTRRAIEQVVELGERIWSAKTEITRIADKMFGPIPEAGVGSDPIPSADGNIDELGGAIDGCMLAIEHLNEQTKRLHQL